MIRLYLLSYKGFYVLSHLKDHLDMIGDVVIGKDKGVENDYSEEITDFCQQHQVPYYYRNEEPQSTSYYTVAIGWRWIIMTEHLIVFHDSLLPRYRGFNPLVSALLNGDKEIGVTSLYGTANYDAGAIIEQCTISIKYPIKINEVIKRISPLYLNLLEDILIDLKKGNAIVGTEQDEHLVSYSLWRNEDDYFINWEQDASGIRRFIDSVGYPYTGARTRLNDLTLIIRDAEEVTDVKIENRMPGKVLFKDAEGLTIVCETGLLKVKKFYTLEGDIFDYTTLFRLKFS